MLKPMKELPPGLEELKTLTLQEGEITGHRHRFLEGSKVKVYQAAPGYPSENSITPNVGKFIQVLEDTVLLHEEHKPIKVEPGFYEVDIVREYDYDKDEVARVAD